MNFKYVPVFKNRQAEREALEKQRLSAKILPLIEMVTEKPRSNSHGNLAISHEKFFRKINLPVMVDIPMYLKLSSNTKPAVRNFLTPILQNPILRVSYFNLLSNLKDIKIIPVISYNPNLPYQSNTIIQQSNMLRQNFNTLAFRIFEQHAKKINI